MANEIKSKLPANWQCPTERGPDRRKGIVSCETFAERNAYGADGKTSSAENPELKRLGANDETIQQTVQNLVDAGKPAPLPLEKQVSVVVPSGTWFEDKVNDNPPWDIDRIKTFFDEKREKRVLNAVDAGKAAAIQFAGDLYARSGGQLKTAEGHRLQIRVVPSEETTEHRAGSLLRNFTFDGKFQPLGETLNDNLAFGPNGLDILINSKTLDAPSYSELTDQYEKGMMFENEYLRMAWPLLNRGGDLRRAAGEAIKGLKAFVSDAATAVATDLDAIRKRLDSDDPAEQEKAKQAFLEVVESKTNPEATANTSAPAAGGAGTKAQGSTTVGSRARSEVASMTPDELKKLIDDWNQRLTSADAAVDALKTAIQKVQTTKLHSKASGLIAVANAHNIDIIAGMVPGSASRFEKYAAGDATTDEKTNIEVEAQGKLVGVATIDVVRVVALMGNVLSGNKLLATGTLDEALTSAVRPGKAELQPKTE